VSELYGRAARPHLSEAAEYGKGLRAGAIIAPLNTRFTAHEHSEIVADHGSRVIFTDPEQTGKFADCGVPVQAMAEVAALRSGIPATLIGYRQYKRGTAPLPERGVLVQAIVDACADAGFDPALIDGFVSYGDDKNEPVRLMPDLGMKELNWSAQVWGGGGGGVAGAFGLASAAKVNGRHLPFIQPLGAISCGNVGVFTLGAGGTIMKSRQTYGPQTFEARNS